MANWQDVFYEGVDRAGHHYAAYVTTHRADAIALHAKQGQILQALEACARYRRMPETILTIAQNLHSYMLRSGQLEIWLDYVGLAVETAVHTRRRPVQFELYLQQEEIYHRLGLRDRQAAVLKTLTNLSGTAAEAAQRALREARYANVTSDSDAALAAAKEAIALAGPYPEIEASARCEAGIVYWYLGDYAKSRAQQTLALQLLSDCERPDLEAKIIRGLAMVAWAQDDYDTAEAYHARALTLYQQIGDRSGEAKSLYNLGFYAQNRTDFATASKLYRQALTAFRSLKDRQSEGMVLNVLGIVDLYEGRLTTAFAYFKRASETADSVADRHNATNGRCNMALCLGRLGDFAQAQALVDDVLVAYRQLDSKRFECMALLYKGLIYHWQEVLDLAESFCRQCLTLAADIGTPGLQGNAQTILGHTLLKQATLAAEKERAPLMTAARSHYEQAIACGQQIAQPEIAVEAEVGLAQLWLCENRLAAALPLVEKGFQYLVERDLASPVFDPLQMLYTCYQVWQAAADDRADAAWQQARQLLQRQVAEIENERTRAKFLQMRPFYQALLA